MCVCEDGFRPGAQVGVGLEIGSRRIRKKREERRAEEFQRTIKGQSTLLPLPGKDEILLSTTLVFTFLTIGPCFVPVHRLLHLSSR